jgi:hypothetical protein
MAALAAKLSFIVRVKGELRDGKVEGVDPGLWTLRRRMIKRKM